MAARRTSARRLSEFDHKRTNSFLEREADARSSPGSSVVGDLPEGSPRRISGSTPRPSETGDGGTSASQGGESEDATSVKWTGRDAESVLSTTVVSTPPSSDRLYPLEQHSTRLEAQQGTRLYPLEQYSSGMHVPKSINGQLASSMEDEEELTPMSAPGSRLPAFKLAKRATEATEEVIGCVDFLSLEHSMEKMTKSLSCWTLRIENEIDHLHENSAILKDALGSIRRLLPVVSGVATPVVSGSAKR